MALPALILAHQGGWDEMLLVAGPIAVFVVLLRVATVRSAKLGDPQGDRAADGSDAGGGPTPDPTRDRTDRPD